MKDPKKIYLNDLAYESNGEYLASIFVLTDLLIFRDPDARMEARGLSPNQDPDVWLEILLDRISVTQERGGVLPIEEILMKIDAPQYMCLILGFFLRCALEPSYEEAAAAERGQTSMTLFDLFSVLGLPKDPNDPAEVYRLLEKGRPCLDLLFPQLHRREQVSGRSIASLMPVMDGRMVSLLLGGEQAENLPAGMVLSMADNKTYERGSQKPAELLRKRAQSMPSETVVLWGREGSGKHAVMEAYAAMEEKGLLFYEMPGSENRTEAGEALSGQNEPYSERLYQELFLVRRECVLGGFIPAISGVEQLRKEEQIEITAFLRKYIIPQTGTVYLLVKAEETPDYLPKCFFLPMEEFRSADRIRLWEEVLPKDALIDRERIEALANTFALTPGQIRDAAEQAILLAGPEEKVSDTLLYEVCYAKLGHPLRGHTQHVKSPFVWDDLKMAAPDKAVLQDLCECVRNRHIVMQEWNFEKRVPYGSGITALFAGPPGTGKTMAAQVIANELKMELYKVDLSQLMDKYVGETEKNIKRVFELAGRSNSVLFFDEADAIFNKRLAADSSNDRFANIESSLLLQCIEEFSGVTLLATNNMGNIDVAFLRRFRFYLLFKEPDEDIRYEIWKSVFPPEAPVKPEVDFRELANLFSFTGAIIKNVAMQAAYLAAERGQEIGMLEIMVAIRREMQKEQRMLSRDSMGKYGYLLPEVLNWNSEIQEDVNGADALRKETQRDVMFREGNRIW